MFLSKEIKGKWITVIDKDGYCLRGCVTAYSSVDSKSHRLWLEDFITDKAEIIDITQYKTITGELYCNAVIMSEEDEIHEEDLNILIDMALDIGDEEWFKELSSRKVGVAV